MLNTPTDPLVSVCIPTYNGEKYLRECIDSALRQTYRRLEIVIVDDCSSDRTVEIARGVADERVRVLVNERNLGLVGNWNRCVREARGDFVKFLFQDDLLYPACVERMLEMFASHPTLGLVFSPRDVILEGDAGAEFERQWLDYATTLHTRFDVVEGANSGRELFAQHMRQKFLHCCVGEPTTVMVKTECFRRVGLFNPLVRQTCDIEMWLRIMYFYDVGFIPEKLSAFRVHAAAATFSNLTRQKTAFDLVWTLEGLLGHEEIRREQPEVTRLLGEQMARHSLFRPPDGWRSLSSTEGRRAAREEAAMLPRKARFRVGHLAHRLRRALGRPRLPVRL